MKLKKITAVFLGAAMIFAGGSVNAMAAETEPLPSTSPGSVEMPAEMPAEMPEFSPQYISSQAVITELALKSGEYSYILIKTQDENPQEIRLNFGKDTVILDTQTGLPVNENDLKVGEKIYAYYSPAMTRSIPPQSHAAAVLVNLDEKHAPANLLTVERADVMDDGTVHVLAENGTIIVKIAADTPISPLYTKNIVKNTDLHMGTQIFAWYDVVALSMPGQAYATKVVVLPNEDREITIISEGDIAIGTGKIENGVAMVPLRLTAEKLGFTVTWDSAQGAVKLTDGKVQTTVKLGEDSYYMETAVQGAVGLSKPSALGAAAYETEGVSWAPAELFNVLLSSDAVRLVGNTLYL